MGTINYTFIYLCNWRTYQTRPKIIVIAHTEFDAVAFPQKRKQKHTNSDFMVEHYGVGLCFNMWQTVYSWKES